MSDIIYTPPASGGGGGGQNPTPNYIPLNNGTSNFIDSNIFNDFNNYLYTISYNNARGLKIDFANQLYFLGDFDYNNNGTSLILDDNFNNIRTNIGGNNIGLNLDFANEFYYLGDFNIIGNGAYIKIDNAGEFILLNASDTHQIQLFINDNSQFIKTKYQGNDRGLLLDFANNQYQINSGVYSYLLIQDVISNFSSIRLINDQNDDRGLNMFYDNTNNDVNYSIWLGSSANASGLNIYYDPDNSADKIQLLTHGGLNQLILDDDSNKMTFTTNSLNFVGASLTDGATVIPASRNLIVTINGTPYRIPLYKL